MRVLSLLTTLTVPQSEKYHFGPSGAYTDYTMNIIFLYLCNRVLSTINLNQPLTDNISTNQLKYYET